MYHMIAKKICCAALAGIIIYSGVWATDAAENSPDVSPVDIKPMEKEVLILSMRMYARSAVEEIFGYILLNDPVEKEDHFKNAETFDRYAKRFRQLMARDPATNEIIRVEFDAVVQNYDELRRAAAVIFKEFEASGVVSRESINMLEAAVLKTAAAFEVLTREMIGSTPSGKIIIDLLEIRASIFGGIENAFAYILLNDDKEKAGSIAKFKKARGLLTDMGNKYPKNTLFLAKIRNAGDVFDNLSFARDDAFRVFDEKKVKDHDSLRRFEQAINGFEICFDSLLKTYHSAE